MCMHQIEWSWSSDSAPEIYIWRSCGKLGVRVIQLCTYTLSNLAGEMYRYAITWSGVIQTSTSEMFINQTEMICVHIWDGSRDFASGMYFKCSGYWPIYPGSQSGIHMYIFGDNVYWSTFKKLYYKYRARYIWSVCFGIRCRFTMSLACWLSQLQCPKNNH